MKPFLGIDVTSDPKNQQINGKEFLVQQPSAALSQSLEASSGQVDQILKTAKLPLMLRVIQFLCGICSLLIVTGILRAEVSLEKGYQNAPWLFWTGGICGAVWLVLWICGKQKANTVLNTDESAGTISHLEGVSQAVYKELGVPEDAKNVDILSFYYKVKNGNIKVFEKSICAQYFNPVFKVFADADYVYLANLKGKFAFPVSSIGELRTVKKHIRIAGWNKEEPFNKGVYKPYKLTSDSYGCIHCKEYHILEIHRNGEAFGIYIPCYELPVIKGFLQ